MSSKIVLTLSIFSDIGLTRWFRRGGGAHSVVWLSNKWSPFDAFSTNLQNCEVLSNIQHNQIFFTSNDVGTFLLKQRFIQMSLRTLRVWSCDLQSTVTFRFTLHRHLSCENLPQIIHVKWPRNVFLKLLITWHNVPPESAQSYHNHLPLALLHFFWGHWWSVQL